jgi:replication factor A1
MKISELKFGTSRVSIRAKVIEIEELRDVNTKRGPTKVCNAKIEDQSGSITLVLWGDDINKIKKGDEIKVENGFVGEWQGSLQLSAGKYGKIEVV